MPDTTLIGKSFAPGLYAVGREKIREYALAVGETNPLHHDLQVARNHGYDDLVAPPMFAVVYCSSSIGAAMLDPELGIEFDRLLHGSQEFRWGPLVIAGDEITTSVTLKDISTRAGMAFYVFESVVNAGDPIPELKVTADKLTPVRYAGASGDFNPIHVDDEFAQRVGLPGRILHGLWTMAQVARALTDAGGGPHSLERLDVTFRGMALPDREITVTGKVTGVANGVAKVDVRAEQDGKAIVRGGEADLRL
jgi:acyl dehydratase